MHNRSVHKRENINWRNKGPEKQKLSPTATQLNKRQVETCRPAISCWPSGRWVPRLGASHPLPWLCHNKPGQSCAQHSRLPQLWPPAQEQHGAHQSLNPTENEPGSCYELEPRGSFSTITKRNHQNIFKLLLF